jgi:hypothetical protein
VGLAWALLYPNGEFDEPRKELYNFVYFNLIDDQAEKIVGEEA